MHTTAYNSLSPISGTDELFFQVHYAENRLLAEIYAIFEDFLSNVKDEYQRSFAGQQANEEERRSIDAPPPPQNVDFSPPSHHVIVGYSNERLNPSWSKPILEAIARYNGPEEVSLRNILYYPPGGFMGWHTNADYPGWRMYLVHVEENRKSFFRRRHPATAEILTHWEEDGCINFFKITDRHQPHWHCIATDTHRWSAGFLVHQPFVEYISRRSDISNRAAA